MDVVSRDMLFEAFIWDGYDKFDTYPTWFVDADSILNDGSSKAIRIGDVLVRNKTGQVKHYPSETFYKDWVIVD